METTLGAVDERKDDGNLDRDKFMTASDLRVSSDARFAAFEAWLLDNGARFPKLELRDYGDEVRGCHSTEAIGEDEVIIEIPLRCLITVEMGKDTDIGRAILASNIELDAPKHIFLMVFVLLDRKNPSSFFRPYYDILPPTLTNMPIFWTPEELGYLQGSYLVTQIHERNSAIEADYAAICKIVPKFSSISTLDEFKWARMCACSRNFGLIVNGLRTAALVPYADMLNHYRPRETKWQFDDALQGFTITSLQQIGMGAQVYDSYGQKCNHRFLLNYGFSVEHNVEPDGFCPNEVPLLLQLKRTDSLFDHKCTYWRRDGSLPAKRVRICVADNDNTRIMLAMLRVIEADQVDLDALVRITGSSTYRSIRDAQIAISIRNEIKAMTLLYALCVEYLSKYKSTYEDDCEAIASGRLPPFSNKIHACIQVRGEKEVLLFYKDFAQTSLELLRIEDPQQFHDAMENLRLVKHHMLYHYCRSSILRFVLSAFSSHSTLCCPRLNLVRLTISPHLFPSRPPSIF